MYHIRRIAHFVGQQQPKPFVQHIHILLACFGQSQAVFDGGQSAVAVGRGGFWGVDKAVQSGVFAEQSSVRSLVAVLAFVKRGNALTQCVGVGTGAIHVAVKFFKLCQQFF